MEKIRYYYYSMSRQVFIILLMIFVLVRFALFVEILVFDINGYADQYNVIASVALYITYFLICVFFFVGYKFFYTTFDENVAVYYNSLLRRKRSANLNKVKRAYLGRMGIRLYYEESEKPCFYVPFFRMGVISPGGVDSFYKLLKAKNIGIEKKFKTLPGHGKDKKWFSILFSCLALYTLSFLVQSLSLVVAILKTL